MVTHLTTQFPNALVGAASVLGGYLMYAVTQNGWVGLAVTLLVVVVIFAAITRLAGFRDAKILVLPQPEAPDRLLDANDLGPKYVVGRG